MEMSDHEDIALKKFGREAEEKRNQHSSTRNARVQQLLALLIPVGSHPLV